MAYVRSNDLIFMYISEAFWIYRNRCAQCRIYRLHSILTTCLAAVFQSELIPVNIEQCIIIFNQSIILWSFFSNSKIVGLGNFESIHDHSSAELYQENATKSNSDDDLSKHDTYTIRRRKKIRFGWFGFENSAKSKIEKFCYSFVIRKAIVLRPHKWFSVYRYRYVFSANETVLVFSCVYQDRILTQYSVSGESIIKNVSLHGVRQPDKFTNDSNRLSTSISWKSEVGWVMSFYQI